MNFYIRMCEYYLIYGFSILKKVYLQEFVNWSNLKIKLQTFKHKRCLNILLPYYRNVIPVLSS
ncbi:hypothetical protein GLOIN_2v1690350 [Rhizophagus irregularis DAOM 181602=DAOM 197198]|uniref:Uncharacterized protein n=1 Tax=Rhizophagus irregularis (strain DAOM 181602 / DAOM 197198 / MUCL 43194) TaxID=747089 RepID=A0A2P4PCC6_RHIID|nr:hypothetical protein GLOIN_2v1690350 [Rhizophagus irregularis DAOM 181602=DAOM 197198]POG63046.1 hypothetical protein GLOIN_2v1690350 [Rhizophagus irregularis DAOM 181602=DAOM 197198]|eukprot:XP_025169912.1 hypothetical protein GLOIN_2v1690350 [Rhizophagus irregularis DAOM 181602=DAOM 197198]